MYQHLWKCDIPIGRGTGMEMIPLCVCLYKFSIRFYHHQLSFYSCAFQCSFLPLVANYFFLIFLFFFVFFCSVKPNEEKKKQWTLWGWKKHEMPVFSILLSETTELTKKEKKVWEKSANSETDTFLFDPIWFYTPPSYRMSLFRAFLFIYFVVVVLFCSSFHLHQLGYCFLVWWQWNFLLWCWTVL